MAAPLRSKNVHFLPSLRVNYRELFSIIALLSTFRHCEMNRPQIMFIKRLPNCNQRLQASFVNLLSSVHVLTLWVVIITQSSFTCIIIDQSPYREFYHTSRYPFVGFQPCRHCAPPDTICAPTLVKSRIFLYILYIYYIYARITMMPPARAITWINKPCTIKLYKLILAKHVEQFCVDISICTRNYSIYSKNNYMLRLEVLNYTYEVQEQKRNSSFWTSK